MLGGHGKVFSRDGCVASFDGVGLAQTGGRFGTYLRLSQGQAGSSREASAFTWERVDQSQKERWFDRSCIRAWRLLQLLLQNLDQIVAV
jgi:hypothetical protein